MNNIRDRLRKLVKDKHNKERLICEVGFFNEVLDELDRLEWFDYNPVKGDGERHD